MAEQNPKKDLLENLRDRVSSVQKELNDVDLTMTDQMLAGKVRGLVSELRARTEALNDVQEFFDQR